MAEQLPFFYEENLTQSDPFILSDATSHHVVKVLRMVEADKMQLTNGKGYLLTAKIISIEKKKVFVKILDTKEAEKPNSQTTIAISPIKNTHRFEWFLEKATEIGVRQIIPLVCNRTLKSHYRQDRMKTILISAMLQSRQYWLPELTEPQKIYNLINESSLYSHKYIAHCIDGEKKNLKDILPSGDTDKIILIGPEGDFTNEEIDAALHQNFLPVSLGETRLRTETAGVVAAVWLK